MPGNNKLLCNLPNNPDLSVAVICILPADFMLGLSVELPVPWTATQRKPWHIKSSERALLLLKNRCSEKHQQLTLNIYVWNHEALVKEENYPARPIPFSRLPLEFIPSSWSNMSLQEHRAVHGIQQFQTPNSPDRSNGSGPQLGRDIISCFSSDFKTLSSWLLSRP